MDKISVIVPCFNEEAALPYFYGEMNKTSNEMNYIDFEFIFIDDGSKDQTLNIIKELSKKDERVKYVSFSRNFGKEAAIFAGFEKSVGDFAVLMDADLQDPPCLLPQMYKAIINEGYDSVATRRVSRKGEPPIRSFFARMFYRIINRISVADIVDGARDYRLMKRKMIDAILSMSEYNRFSKGIFGWIGFKTKWIEFENVERIAGETKWSFWKLFKYSLEGIIAFSVGPLQAIAILGIVLFFFSILIISIVVIRTIAFGDPVSGWPSLICIITFIGGIQLLSLGVVGQYLSKLYLEAKKRPIYIEKESKL